MKKTFTINVPHPCTESWDQMKPQEQGRFCNVCQKTVHDFTQYSDEEFVAFFREKHTVSCGRFWKRQLSIVIEPERKALFPWAKLPPLAAATLIAAGLSITAPAQSLTKEVATHVIVGDTILQKKPVDIPLLQGKVLDENGEAVIGATVILKGTTMGTVTDADGSFDLTGMEFQDYTIQVRYLGMVSQELVLKPGVPVTVELKIDETDIGEITTYGGIQ